MKMSFPCERHAIFRKTRDRSRSGIFTRKGAQVPQEIEPGLPKNIKGTLPITAQTSKSHFQRDRCGFRKSTCRTHGKLIFEVAAIHLDAKASPGAISESVLAFFRWKQKQHRPGDCSGRGFATQIEARGLENELPVYTARRFPKSTQVGL